MMSNFLTPCWGVLFQLSVDSLRSRVSSLRPPDRKPRVSYLRPPSNKISFLKNFSLCNHRTEIKLGQVWTNQRQYILTNN